MPPTSKGNGFVHLELNSPDLEMAKSFYNTMFGWEITDMPAGPGMVYATFKPADGPGGGMFSINDAPTGWLPYIGVEDIDAATAQARELGAMVFVDAQEIPGVGWMTVLNDPTGCRIAFFEPAPTSVS